MTDTPRSPITCDEFDAMLPDLIEGTASEGARVVADAHASSCARCAGLLADLIEIRTEASRLPVLKPSRDLWDGISKRIETPPIAFMERLAEQRRGARMRMAAAAVALVTVTATATWMLIRTPATPVVASVPESGSDAPIVNPAFHLASAYDSEIAALRTRMAERVPLDAATQRVVDENMRVIDDAIARVRTALESAPSSALLSQQLVRAYNMKVNTLRQIAALQTD